MKKLRVQWQPRKKAFFVSVQCTCTKKKKIIVFCILTIKYNIFSYSEKMKNVCASSQKIFIWKICSKKNLKNISVSLKVLCLRPSAER